MKHQPTSICSCEVAYCTDLHVNSILHALLRMKKGPQHIIMVDGSHEMTGKNRHYRTYQLKEKVRNMELPYTLYFYEHGPALVCFWECRDSANLAAKEWFDKNAELGIYPEVLGLKKVKR